MHSRILVQQELLQGHIIGKKLALSDFDEADGAAKLALSDFNEADGAAKLALSNFR